MGYSITMQTTQKENEKLFRVTFFNNSYNREEELTCKASMVEWLKNKPFVIGLEVKEIA